MSKLEYPCVCIFLVCARSFLHRRGIWYTACRKNLHTVVTTFDCTFLLLIENNSLSLLEWPFWRGILTVNIIGVGLYAVRVEVTAGNYLELLHLEIICLYVCDSAITLDIFNVEIWGESLKEKYYRFTVFLYMFLYISYLCTGALIISWFYFIILGGDSCNRRQTFNCLIEKYSWGAQWIMFEKLSHSEFKKKHSWENLFQMCIFPAMW